MGHLTVEKMWDQNWRLFIYFTFKQEVELPATILARITYCTGSCLGFETKMTTNLLSCLEYSTLASAFEA